jgi:membrane fusion protein (multidrug efflux system)
VRLVLDDGTLYAQPGKLLFSDATVDPSTGQVTLRGEFPNPKHELLPGMYVRVQIEQGIDDDAIAVPQQAVQRNAAGGSEVYVLRHDNRVVVQPIRTGRTVEADWLVLDGLKNGDRVVVEGFQKISAGAAVRPVTWNATRRAEAETASSVKTR